MFIVALIMLIPSLSLATDVGGIINIDTTWDSAGSPYNLINTVEVAEGVTLTIEPGVQINRGEDVNVIALSGSLYAVGTESAKVFFNGIALIRRSINTAMRIEFGEFSGEGGLIYGRHLTLRNSTLQSGTKVELLDGDCYVEKNIFYDALLIIYNTELNVIRNNVFYPVSAYPAAIGVGAYCSNPLIEYNSFLNTNLIAIELGTGDTECSLIASSNYWNTRDKATIDTMIYDGNDNLQIKGFVIYDPILDEPHPDTPPVAILRADPEVGPAALEVNFTTQSPLAITSWHWDFGDGGTSTDQNPAHIYTDPGIYVAELTVTDELGLQHTDSCHITVKKRLAMPWIPLLLLDSDRRHITAKNGKAMPWIPLLLLDE
jgi:hypothetical protein